MAEKFHRKPLDGVIVLDFTWSVAGPTMTRYLGAFGATVIKVEWPKGPDPMRTAMFHAKTHRKTMNNGPFFANLNVGKRSFSVNVKDDLGKKVIRDLIRQADVVTESFSSGVLSSWGLGFEEQKKLNPKIIYASISGFGHTGPHSTKNTWGPTAQAMSGITAMSGVAGRSPAGWGYSYLDVTAGYMGAIAVMAALKRVADTCEPQRIDVSQVETGLSLSGPALTAYLTRGALPPESFPGGNWSIDNEGRQVGNRGDSAIISDAFKTAGKEHNDWMVLSLSTDEQWDALCRAFPEFLGDWQGKKLADISESLEEIRQAIQRLCLCHDKYALSEELTCLGIPAGPVQGGADRVQRDPQLRHRELLKSHLHPELEEFSIQEVPFREAGGETLWGFEPRFDKLSQSTHEILKTILGYSEEQVQELESQHVLWPEGLDRELTVERSLW